MSYTLDAYAEAVRDRLFAAPPGEAPARTWSACKWGSYEHQQAVHALAASALGPGDFADLGCGTADLLSHIPRERWGDYRGLDAVPEMIEYARGHFPEVAFEIRAIETLGVAEWTGVVCLGLLPDRKLFPRILAAAHTWVVADFTAEGEYDISGWAGHVVGADQGRVVVRFDRTGDEQTRRTHVEFHQTIDK